MASRRTRTRLTPLGKVVVTLLAAGLAVILVRMASGGEPAPAPGGASPSPGAFVSNPDGPPLPACIYGDLAADHRGYDQWNRTLLDTEFRVPRGYVPPDLVPVSEAGFSEDFLVREIVVADLKALREAAVAAGHPLDVVAAYRSWQQQADLFQRRQDEFGYQGSLDRTARAGHSEHQLGTVVDFKSLGAADVTQSWGSGPTGRWMSRNAHRYGFVLSYPDGRRSVTCYPYEPWHFRYLGRDLAARAHASGRTLREFLWGLNHP
jgi:D-alanyl-D-alanine carboxypeptidase